MNNLKLENEEKIMFALRRLYKSYGYSKFKMSKFEEYDLYAKNKDFLVSDNIITFNDGDGKLMALKPDVTLSIVKNSKDSISGVRKVYYNENVYRVSGDTNDFKEIMQIGLECIGDIDNYSVTETVLLAAKSLECISEDFVLDISHTDVVLSALDAAGISEEGKKRYFDALGEKNFGAVLAICETEGVNQKDKKLLCDLVTLYGEPSKVIDAIKDSLDSASYVSAINRLQDISDALEALGYGDRIRIDFSVANNMKYYLGVAFKGFVNGVPVGILSGGQYDKLMRKMGKSQGAIGFAIYFDMLERMLCEEDLYDVEVLLLYSLDDSMADISKAVETLSKDGSSVLALKEIPQKLRYKKLMKIEKGEAILIG